MTATLTAPAPPRMRRGGRSRETVLFLIGLALIALHVLDDNFVQPQPGTSPGDHLVSGLVPLTLLGLAAWAYPRLSGGWRGALALFLGPLAIAGGIEGFYYSRELGPSGDDFTGLLCFPAGVLLLGLGAVTLWRTRRTDGRIWWRYPRRALLAAGGLVVALAVVLPIGLAYVTTHTGRAVVPPNHLGVPYEDVSFTTGDGLELEGWYVPSRNGAAVFAFPGRNGPQKQTRMLARHGYGVLLFDRRGAGDSAGEPNSWGWGGEPDRIGGIGLSVGGEMMIEAAAETDELAAVVSEGAGARSTTEDMDEEHPALEKWTLGFAMSAAKTAAVAVSSNQSPPANLKDLAAKIEQPLLLIAAPVKGVGEELNRGYATAAGKAATLWEIPESSHVGGITARPREYERRVIGFFDRALRP